MSRRDQIVMSAEETAAFLAGQRVVVCATSAQAAKRVALQFVARRTASWDHRKLGNVY